MSRDLQKTKWLYTRNSMNNFKIGYFLATRQLFRGNRRSVVLVIAVMVFTFLNLVAVSGILVGLIEGSSVAYRAKYIGDLVISPLANKKVVQDTGPILAILNNQNNISGFTVRYINSGSIESNYNKRDAGKRREIANGNILGIKASAENKVTDWQNDILEGSFLDDFDTGKIVVGKNMLARYSQVPQDRERSLGDVAIGEKVLVTINGNVNEFILKGVLNGKTDASRQAYISDTDMKKMIPGDGIEASSINVRMKNPGEEVALKKVLVSNGLDEHQKIETYEEGEPSFVKDLKKVFSILGTAIGSIGIIVASITIFIIIYINALTRRKYIGIMKGIGIAPSVIEISYILQSIFYGVIGSAIGAVIVYTILIPLFTAYPIDFPFSDGIMVAPFDSTLNKFLTLMFFTILAGYLPARSIVKQNTLNAILGR